MATANFTSELKYDIVSLFWSWQVAEHSFVVQNSLSPLDLDVKSAMTPFVGSYPRRMINTQEKSRKFYSRSRSLLYTFHLDLSKSMEWSLKSGPCSTNFMVSEDSPYIARIKISDKFYVNNICDFMDYAYNDLPDMNTNRFEKILQWFLELEEVKQHERIRMSESILKLIVDRMHVEPADSKFIDRCLKVFDFKDLVDDGVTTKTVRRLLYVVRRNSNTIDITFFTRQFSDYCLLQPLFMFVGEVLKFLNTPHLGQSFADLFIDRASMMEWSYALPPYIKLASLQWNNRRRFALLLHLYWTYLNKSNSPIGSSEYLQLFWRAVRDPFLTCTEITVEFARTYPDLTAGMYDFYSEAVGESNEHFVPRSLQHLCRTTIRARLWENGRWLPEGIENVGLPAKLQSYLKLEE